MGEGNVRRTGPGDAAITPKGGKGCWESPSRGMKAQAIRKETDAGLDAPIRPGKS